MSETRQEHGLKHFIRETYRKDGSETYRLLGGNGEVEVFTEFMDELMDMGRSLRTRHNYALHASQFLDFLVETDCLSDPPPTEQHVKKEVKLYRKLLEQGVKSSDNHIRDVACSLPRKLPQAPSSIGVAISACNHFLRVADEYYEDVKVAMELEHGVELPVQYKPFMDALPTIHASGRQLQKIRETSVLAGVVRKATRNAWKQKGLCLGRTGKSEKSSIADDVFPIDCFPDVLNATKSWRDKALYTLLISGGPRVSEALQIRWDMIDMERRVVYVNDPNRARSLLTQDERMRNKGRNISRLFMFPPYRDLFFYYLERYSRDYIATPRHNFIFEVLEGKTAGRPLCFSDHSDILKGFKRACARANISGPSSEPTREWWIHALRDTYGTYLYNRLPWVDENGKTQRGIKNIDRVSRFMGHRDIRSTTLYAKVEIQSLDAIMASTDSLIRGINHIPSYSLKELQEDRQIAELLTMAKDAEDIERMQKKLEAKKQE